jgi:hypothetical protein
MIELPDFAVPTSMQVEFLDPGFTQRGIQSLERIDRKGGRFKLSLTYGPYRPDDARVMVSRLLAGKQEGLRVPYPLLHSQGSPGSPLLNGAVNSGRTLVLDGFTPGYFCKEGYVLSLVKSGQHFLHTVRTGGRANASGELTITLNELVRDTFADNTVVNFAKPMIEGLVEGDTWAWGVAIDRVTPIEFTLEEVQ